MIRLYPLVFFLMIVGCSQPARTDQTCRNYDEADFPVTVHSDWEALSKGLKASIGSIDTRYVKHEIPGISQQRQWQGSAWRGERVSAQMVVWSRDSVSQIRGEFGDFKMTDGKTIPADAASIHFVRYVITDEFAEGCGHRIPEDYASSLSADVLDNLSCFNLSPHTTRPVWITIDVPPDAAPGIYTSTLQLFADGKKREQFSFQLEVLPQILPPATEWAFHLDLWQNPYAVARVAGVEPWSQAHWEALRPVMKMLGDAGQKVITATLNKRPWNGQTEDAFGSMIGWTKKSEGSWAFDYTIFDHWVQFMMDLGIKKQINCYSMVPWGNIFYYFDEKEGQEIKVSAAPGTKEYADLWEPFLEDFVKHLDQKGWRDITRIAMDERNPTEMKAMLKLLDEAAPGMGVALADNHKSYKEYPDRLTDLCVAYGAVVEPEDRIYRAEKGYVTTWYVCCADVFPNVFTFSDPAEGAFIGWYTMAAGFDGFLRWAYNSWVKEPLIDSRFRTWPAGDTYIVYPDGRSSIRFERLREGIQDAEKIRILRKKLQNEPEKIKRLEEMLQRLNILEKPEDLNSLMREGKELLEKLSR
ncbi:MAG: glycoside hydrolase domain-containing protein [Proteiniphilum sp.]